MKKTLSALAVLFAAFSLSTAFAAQSVYECTRDDDGDDWRITVKMDGSLASFWDNDHTIALKNVGSVPSRKTGEMIHRLEGKDGDYAQHFGFNADAARGTLYANLGTADEFSLAFSCEIVKDSIDWKEVEKAIKNAGKDGSTRY